MRGRETGSTSPLVSPPAVTAYFEALNSEDWESMSSVWAEDAELRAVGSRPRRGRENILSYFRTLFAPWSEHREGPTRLIVSGDVVVAEIEFAGVTRGGKQLAFDAVDVFDLQRDTITRLSTWYDLTWVRAQL